MNQYRSKAFLVALVLVACALLMGSCIRPVPGDFYTTIPDTTVEPPEITVSTTPEQTTPEPTTPQETTTKEPITETTTEATTPPPKETTTETETTTQPPEPPKPPVEKIKIYIDQGHNPFSPTHPPSWNTGASNEQLGLYEQDLTYEIGMLLAKLLAEDERFEVRLSRPTAETILGTDNDSALDFRVNDAAEWGADYFVSLHINDGSSLATGIEAYAFNKENEGYALGGVILEELQASTGMRNRGMKIEEYRVLKNATMPAVLVEMGFISNEDDAILLRDHPELFAQGLYNGIQSYFDALEEESDATTQQE